MAQPQPDAGKPSFFATRRRSIMLIAALGFAIGIFLSYRAEPTLLNNIDWHYVTVLAIVAIPLTVVANTLEFCLMGRMVGCHFRFFQSLEITVIGSVANLLPIPGSTIVRIAALKEQGASVKKGSIATLSVSALWIGIAFIYAGAWLLTVGTARFHLAACFLIFGVSVLFASCVFCYRLSGNKSVIVKMVAVKFALVLIDGVRIWLCFGALSQVASFAQASVLTVSSVTGAAVSIVPAGLGVREAVAALIGPVVSLTAASSYLATSLNRLVGLVVMSPVAMTLSLRRRQS